MKILLVRFFFSHPLFYPIENLMCRCINAVDLLIDNDFHSYIECWVNFSRKWGPIPGWSVDLKIDWPTESRFPKFIRRRFLLKCWFTILTKIDRENNSKFNQCVRHILVDQLISKCKCLCPEIWKIRYSAQMPVDPLIYQND